MIYVRFKCDTCPRETNGHVIPQREAIRENTHSGNLEALLGTVRLNDGWVWDGEKLRCWQCAEKG